MPKVELSIGTIGYRSFGPDRSDEPTAVFVHGFLTNGTLWDPVAEQLAHAGVRSIVADWPLGSHRIPIPTDRELSPESIAAALGELLVTLDLDNVILVGNDTGGAICQLALRGDTSRVSGLVLTNCDAFEQFPPAFFVPLFILARSRLAVSMVLSTTRIRLLRHSPLAYGHLLGRPRPHNVTRAWVEPALADAAIRRDITRFARQLDRSALVDAASWLKRFDRPARMVWGTNDRHFKLALAHRLAEALPAGDVIEVEDATTFVPIENPTAVAAAITDVAQQSSGLRGGETHL